MSYNICRILLPLKFAPKRDITFESAHFSTEHYKKRVCKAIRDFGQNEQFNG